MAPLAPTGGLRGLNVSVTALSAAVDDAERIDRLRQLEELKAAIGAAQAVLAVDFDRSRRAAAAVAGEPPERQGRGIANQVALALRMSPWQAQRWLGWAKIVTGELPATFRQLAAGRTTQWRTMLVARETAVLSREDRVAVDRDVAPHLEGWGDKQVDIEVRTRAYRLDPHAAVARAARAEQDRQVGLRPAPDTMCRLTALLPVAEGVACYAALRRTADSTAGVGDEARTRGQVMADTLVERLTGQVSAAAVPVEIELVMSEAALLGAPGSDHDEPAWLPGYGPVPAGVARRVAYGDGSDAAPRWIRRLHTRSGRLVGLDSTRRRFTPAQQRFLRLRDRTCRTPWCDAPIRHGDHVTPHRRGGRTHVANGQGLCESCNHARQALYWHSRVRPDGTIITRTPTGHAYCGRPPDLSGPCRSPLERRGWHLACAA